MRKWNLGIKVSVSVIITLLLLFSMTWKVAHASPKVKWKWNFSSRNENDMPSAKSYITEVIPRVKQRTNGNFIITAHYADELGVKTINFTKAVAAGLIEMGWAYPGYYAGDMPIIQVNALPALVSSMEQYKVLSRITRKSHERTYRKVYKGAVDLIAVGPYNWVNLATTKPMVSITDWSKMKIRVPDSVSMKMINRMNGVGLQTTWAEIVPALHQGVASGVMTSLDSMTKSKFYEICKYLYLVNLIIAEHHVFVSSKALSNLPQEYKQILIEELTRAEQLNWGKLIPENKGHEESIEVWRKYGATIIELNPDEAVTLRNKIKPLWEEWNESIGGGATDILKEYTGKFGIKYP